MKLATGSLALLLVLTLAGCGGGSEGAAPGGGGDSPAATAPGITTQPVAQSVTAPATATFSVVASGTAPLTYQWRSSSNGTDWSSISGATTASYQTGATDATMQGRYFSVVVTNTAGSVTSASVQLTVLSAPAGPTGPIGEFPHTANPLAVAITPAADAVSAFDVTSTADATTQVPSGAADLAVDSGVTVSIGVPGNAFLEDQTLAVTTVALAALDVSHPLPFQTVLGAFVLGTADSSLPELQAMNLLRIRFTLTQQALDALGGQPVIFSARADGSQLHLMPVFKNEDGSWSTLALTTSAAHLGIFGIATVSSDQAVALAAAWPSFEDFQLEAAVASPSYQWREAALSGQAKTQPSRLWSLTALWHAASASATDDGFAQLQARIDAYYNDEVAPAINAANAADADLAQFRDATQKISTWERMRQLLGIADESDTEVTNKVLDYTRRGIQIGMQDCQANGNAAAAVQILGLLRQAALLGIETDVTLQSVLDTCGRSTYDISVTFSQVHNVEQDGMFDGDPANNNTSTYRLNTTASGAVHVAQTALELNSTSLDATGSYEMKCADGAYRCTYVKSTTTAHETSPTISQCGSPIASYRVDRWNLDARGRLATPLLYVTFQNSFGCANSSFILVTTQAMQTDVDVFGNSSSRAINLSEGVDTTSWSGNVNLGASSRIVRRSAPLAGQFTTGTERWTTSLGFKITEVPPAAEAGRGIAIRPFTICTGMPSGSSTAKPASG